MRKRRDTRVISKVDVYYVFFASSSRVDNISLQIQTIANINQLSLLLKAKENT